jgi:hypothetical protein
MAISRFKAEDVLKEVVRRLRAHPGDAPWSCVECYHSRPCKERQILEAAKIYLEMTTGKVNAS